MKDASWVNQYINLVGTKPGFILDFQPDSDINTQRTEIQRRSAQFPRLICELGCGSGEHLIEIARRNRDALCLGFELRFKRTFRSAEKAEQAGLDNILFARTDARAIGELLEPSSVDAFYINFPDPWAKRRWRKHRLINEAFLTTIARLLKNGGVFSHKTDSAEYFAETSLLVDKMEGFSRIRTSNDLHAENDPSNVFSEFERLFKSQGLPVYLLETRKSLVGF